MHAVTLVVVDELSAVSIIFCSVLWTRGISNRFRVSYERCSSGRSIDIGLDSMIAAVWKGRVFLLKHTCCTARTCISSVQFYTYMYTEGCWLLVVG